MKIADKSVVEMHYTLTNDQGEILDSSEGRDPLTFIQGTSSIVPGLEKALEGKATGENLQVTVTPEEGYGVRDESLTQTVALSNFGDQADQVKVGISFQMPTDQGVAIATVTSVENGDVNVDLNHPLADVTLNFNVEVISIREATEEELEHGHIHGAGCNH